MWRALIPALLLGCGFSTAPDTRTVRSFSRLSVGTKPVLSTLDVSAFDAAFLAPDGAGGFTEIPTEHVPGGWAAELDEALGSPLRFKLPDFPTPLLRFFDFPQPQVTSLFGVLEHPDPQPPPPGSTFSLEVALDRQTGGGEAHSMFGVGTWVTYALPASTSLGSTVLTATFSHDAMASLSGRPHGAFTRDDALFVLRTSGNGVTNGVAAIPPFDEAPTNALVATMVPVPLDRRVAVQFDRDAATTRLLGAAPAIGSFGALWQVTAAPGAAYAAPTGPLLGTGSLGVQTTMIDAVYGNPFIARGWPGLLAVQAYGTRQVATRLLPMTLFGGLFEYRLADSGGAVALAAGMPQALTFDGTPLTSDNLVLPRPRRPVDVRFQSDRPESPGIFQLALYELVPNAAGTALTYRALASFAGLQRQFRVPPELFEPGHLYVFRAITTTGGYEAAAFEAGDMTKRSLPLAVGYLDAGVFEVQ